MEGVPTTEFVVRVHIVYIHENILSEMHLNIWSRLGERVNQHDNLSCLFYLYQETHVHQQPQVYQHLLLRPQKQVSTFPYFRNKIRLDYCMIHTA